MADITILLVEDESIEAMDIKRTLESFGYQVPYVASSGEEALEKALDILPDLILMDIILKGEIDGIEAALKIKELNIPIIYLTAHFEEPTIERAKLTEPNGYIIKPYDRTELKYAIELAIYKNQMKKKLKESEKSYRELVDNSMVAIYKTNLKGDIIFANDAMAEMFNFESVEELKTKKSPQLYKNPEDRKKMIEKLKEGKFSHHKIEMISNTGETITILLSAHLEDQIISGMMMDITEREQAEETQRRLNRELHAISNCNQTLLRAVDEQTLLNEICRIICDEAGYHLAWVGYAEQDQAKTIRPVAWAGFESGYIKNTKLSWSEDTEHGLGPAGIVIRSGEIVYVQDFATDPLMAPWRESALERGYRSGIALPLKDEKSKVFGVLLIYSSNPNAINPDEIKLMDELAGDLAFGITALRTRTERKRAEKRLNLSESRLNEAQRIAHIGSWELDLVTNKLQWSDEIYRIFEIDPKQFGASYESFLDFIHPEDRDMVNQAYTDSANNRTPYDIIHRLKLSDGQIKFVHDRCETFYNEEGKPISSLGTVQDISERKKAEAELQDAHEYLEQLISSANVMIIGLDTLGHVRMFNKAAERITGYTIDELTDINWFEKIVPKDRYAYVWEVFQSHQQRTGAMPTTFENPILTKNEEERFISWQNSTISSPDKVISTISFGIDITDRKMAEKKIKRSLKEKEVLLSEIHHRVKNNMQIISSLLNLQSEYVVDDEAVEVLQASQNRVKAMATIYEKLSKSQDLSRINFAEYIRSLVQGLFYSHTIKKGQINLIIEIEDIMLNIETALPCGLIISELVSNSLKHAFPEGKKGKVCVSLKVQNNKYVLKISDDGIGFPEDIDFKNTYSLGLKLVNILVRQINGEININRSPGTEFKITFKELEYKERI